MRKTLYAFLCLVLALSVHLPGTVAQPPPGGNVLDPEPPVKSSLPTSGPEGMQPEAILEPAWTAPVADMTYSLAWGDYNLDGNLDLLVGNFGENRVYANVGQALTETFTLVCNELYPDNSYSAAWGDYDRDGYLDIAVGNFGGVNCIFHNEVPYGGGFDKAWEAEFAQNTTSVAWAGWELGGEYSAYLAMGFTDDRNAVYRYEAGDFDLWWTDPVDAATYSLAWGDYDQDGDPDLAVGNFGQANSIYRNDGTGLTSVFTTTAVSYTLSVAWGDVNGDDYLDLAVGNNGSTGVTDRDQVYCNGGPPDYVFSLCWTSDDASLTTKVAWGDYNGDGDLDLAATSESDGLTRIYFNSGTALTTYYQWDADDETDNSQAVTWSDWDGDGDMELTIGYYPGANVLFDNTQGSMISTAVSNHVLDTRSVAWGDMNGDSLLDLAVGNSSGTPNQVFTSDGSSLTLAWTSPDGQNTRSVAWGDFDGDGDQDLAVGNGQQGGDALNQVFCSNGEDLDLCETYGDGNTYSVAWGDFDGDQDLDLAVGNFETDQANQVYVNGISQGSFGFSDAVDLPYPGDETLGLAWGDFDQDYDLDLAVANNNGPDRVYVNDGDGSFPESITLPHDPENDDTRGIAWGDWDDDGDLDLAVGNAGSDGFVQILAAEQVSDTWTFQPVFTSTGAFLDVRSVAWGDYNGDGNLDLAVGVHGQWEKRNLIYRNVGGTTMVKVWMALAADADATRSVAWGDFDDDGDLDLATGNVVSPANPNRLFVNAWNDEYNLANDPAYVVVDKPGSSEDAWFFANHEIIGLPAINVPYTLYDDEGDQAFRIEPQISWDGGENWETAWEAGGDGIEHLDASPGGTPHLFVWDALNHLLDHQGYEGIPVPEAKTDEEMDVAFRIGVWSNPEHGGLIQRPTFGSDTTLFRVDMRPDWYSSTKLAEPEIVYPGETVEFTIWVTQTDHGMPPGGTITDPLPVELSLIDTPSWNTGNLDWTSEVVTWTGALDFGEELIIQFNAEVTRPLTNSHTIENCAYIFDGLHPQFTRCATVVISSTPTLSESWKLVNDLPSNTALPGDPLTYTLVLTNTGTDNARDASLADELPPHVLWGDYLTATSGTAVYANGTVTWLGTVDVYEPVTITYRVTIVTPLPGFTLITNTAEVWDGIDPPFYISPPVTTTILAPNLWDSHKTSSPTQVELGDLLTYTILLTNTGALNASPVDLYDPILPTSSYVPGSFWSSSGLGGYDPAGNAITWTGDVDMGTPVTVTFAITAGCPLSTDWPVIINTAYAEDPVGGLVMLTATAAISLPDLSPSFKAGHPHTIIQGDLLTYTIVVSNAGGYAPDVWIYDTLSPHLHWNNVYSVSQGTLTYYPGTHEVQWMGGALDHGDVATITFQLEVDFQSPVYVILNYADIWDGCLRITRSEATYVQMFDVYLPLISKHH